MGTFAKNKTSPEVAANVDKAYPGALKNSDLAKKVKKTLEKHGFTSSNTQLATSLCCDEVNRELDDEFRSIYGFNFSMGGLAGFPFGGITSFGAMAHHIPLEGHCLVIYGPHVGVDADGAVGKVNRRGRPGPSGACCGSATAAAGYVKGVVAGETKEAEPPTDPVDAQQYFVGAKLLPYGERIKAAEDASVEVPLALFDSQDEMMKSIVAAGCNEVAGKGLIALLGGIQINTPGENSDFFLVKTFEVMNNEGKVVESVTL